MKQGESSLINQRWLAANLPITDRMHKRKQNESDQWQKVDFLCKLIVVVVFGQIVAADHEMGGEVAERGEHQEGATSEQVDCVSAQAGEAGEANIDFLIWMAIIINLEMEERKLAKLSFQRLCNYIHCKLQFVMDAGR